MKTNIKMRRGFMCQDPTATAMCMTPDPRAVIVPRRSMDRTLVEHASLISNNTKYARIVESRRFRSASTRSTTSMAPMQNDKKIVEKDQKAPHRLSSVASSEEAFQVVVMRVSLHCQGCAGKVKKHLSKMEGVTSFSIELESKRVTVRGHVSPVGVLESISKVKKAEFWPC